MQNTPKKQFTANPCTSGILWKKKKCWAFVRWRASPNFDSRM